MTDWPTLFVTALGSLAVAGALFYSARQVRVLTEQLELEHGVARSAVEAQRAQNDLTLMMMVVELDRLFIERPHLRPYFYSGNPIPFDGEERESVLATAELVVDLAESVSSMIRHNQLSIEDRRAWIAAIADWGLSPAVRWVARQDLGGDTWDHLTVSSLLTHPVAGEHPLSSTRVDESDA